MCQRMYILFKYLTREHASKSEDEAGVCIMGFHHNRQA